ncbi:hypothetical protein ACMGE9_00365 [Macrococcus sp. EM39E]|uniref:hypothetical protein n=1 Tax=Macrococcus animalis TaxID=3395467 RepID=UPI0039BE04E2
MKKILALDYRIMRNYPLIILGLFLFTIVMKIIIGQDLPTKFDQNKFTFNFSDTFFMFTMVSIFFLLSHKYEQLRKYKTTKWYDSLPFTKRELRLANFTLVIVPHLILIIFAVIFYSINDDFYKINGLFLMFGISLIMNGLMLIIGIKNTFWYVILASFGGALLLFAFGFHHLLVMNDFNMNLNLGDNPYWYFYLYQLPYIVTAIGFIICISSQLIYRND